MNHPTNRAIANAISGMSQQEDILSNQLKIVEDKIHSAAISRMTTTTRITDLCLLIGCLVCDEASVTKATATSIKEIVEVTAAMHRSEKNRMLLSHEKDIFSKIAGKTMNTNSGPSAGSTPKAKTAGKIITPAKMATAVSSSTTCKEVAEILWDLGI